MHSTPAAVCLALGLMLSTTPHALASPLAGDTEGRNIRIAKPSFGIDPATLARPSRPPSGVQVDEQRSVTMLATMPAPCASVVTGNAVFYLSTQRLTALADQKPAPVAAGQDSVPDIGATRAAKLLTKLTGPKDEHGCVTLQGAIDEGDKYTLLDEVERGVAHARTAAGGAPIATVSVHYLTEHCGTRCGWGNIHVRLPEHDADELTLGWWIF